MPGSAMGSAFTGTSGIAMSGSTAHTAKANGYPKAVISAPNVGGTIPAVNN